MRGGGFWNPPRPLRGSRWGTEANQGGTGGKPPFFLLLTLRKRPRGNVPFREETGTWLVGWGGVLPIPHPCSDGEVVSLPTFAVHHGPLGGGRRRSGGGVEEEEGARPPWRAMPRSWAYPRCGKSITAAVNRGT